MSEGIFDSLSQLGQEGGWQVVELGLLVDDQEPDGLLIGIDGVGRPALLAPFAETESTAKP